MFFSPSLHKQRLSVVVSGGKIHRAIANYGCNLRTLQLVQKGPYYCHGCHHPSDGRDPMIEDGEHLVGMEDPTHTTTLYPASLTTHIFTSRDLNLTTRDPAKYFIPFAYNNPTFDSFFRCGEVGVGLQMTISEEHTLDIKGLCMIYGRLMHSAEQVFVFVIPPGRKFRCKKPTPTYMAWFKCFTLNLPMSDSENISQPWVSACMGALIIPQLQIPM